MMDCEKIRGQIYTFLDGEVDWESSQLILKHLNDCRDCFTYFEFHKILKKVIKKCAELDHPEPVLKKKILEEIYGAAKGNAS